MEIGDEVWWWDEIRWFELWFKKNQKTDKSSVEKSKKYMIIYEPFVEMF